MSSPTSSSLYAVSPSARESHKSDDLINSHGPEVVPRSALETGTDLQVHGALQGPDDGPIPIDTEHNHAKPTYLDPAGLEKGALYSQRQVSQQHRKCCGIKQTTFLIALVLGLLVVAGIIAGAVAGVEVNKHNSSSSSSGQTMATGVTSGVEGIAANDCHSTTTGNYTSSVASVNFDTYCFTNWPTGDPAADGSNGTVPFYCSSKSLVPSRHHEI